ncbi:MAG: AI-2E family transporter [Chloroflexota bacterium]
MASLFLITALLLTAVIYGRDVLMPLSLAAVIAFALAPPVSWLARFNIPRAIAVSVVLLTVIAAGLWGATVFSTQILSLTASLATYRVNLADKMHSLSPEVAGGALQRAADSLRVLQTEFEKQTHDPRRDEQIRVVVENADGGVAGLLETARSALGPAETVLLTLVYVAVLLTGQYDLADRMVRLAGVENMSRTTAALATAGERLSKFFVRQSAINVAFGATIGVGLGLLGIPSAILWGMGAAIFRFIPFIGVFVAAVPPILLAAAVAPGWSLLLAVLGLYLLVELVTANVIEPIVVGRHVGLSPLAFVAAGTFWWLVWGPIGLLLASPLTTVFVVLGEFFPSMEFATLLFGDRPPLTPAQEYYHRLLAGDSDTAANTILKNAEARNRLSTIDDVVIPALAIAAKDLRDHRISADRGEKLAETIREVSDFISADTPQQTTGETILVPGHGPIDATAVELISEVLSQASGIRCAAFRTSTGLLALSSLKAEEEADPHTLILFSVGGLSAPQMRHMSRKALSVFPEARVIVLATEEVVDLQGGASAGRIVQCATLSQVEKLLQIKKGASETDGEDKAANSQS